MTNLNEISAQDPSGQQRGRGTPGPAHRHPDGQSGGGSRGGPGGKRRPRGRRSEEGPEQKDTEEEGEPDVGPRRSGRNFGRPGGWQQIDLPSADDATSWFSGRLPADWFADLEITVDREEIVVVGTLADTDSLEGSEAEGRISRFRADSRETRMEVAEEAQQRYRRKVSWGAKAGQVSELFTHVSVPVMTRLKQPERRVLDTLVDTGVARSRSEALSWAVRLVGDHTQNWLSELRTAMAEVDKLRSEGPEV